MCMLVGLLVCVCCLFCVVLFVCLFDSSFVLFVCLVGLFVCCLNLCVVSICRWLLDWFVFVFCCVGFVLFRYSDTLEHGCSLYFCFFVLLLSSPVAAEP